MIHNFRLRNFMSREESIDSDRTNKNQVLINTLGVKNPNDLADKLTTFYKGKNAVIKDDSVLMLDFVLTTSPEYWGDNWTSEIDSDAFKEKLSTWVKVQTEFMEKEFPGLVKLAVLHLDEKTPHCHFQISVEETKNVTFSNRHGSTTKEKTVLNAKRWNPQFFVDLVTRHAEANAHFGLERGKKGANVTPKPLKDYKNELALLTQKQKKMIKSYIRSIEDHEAIRSTLLQLQKEHDALSKENIKLMRELNRIKGELSPDYMNSLGL